MSNNEPNDRAPSDNPWATRGPTPKAVRVLAELRRRGFNAETIAAGAGVSPNTIRFVFATGQLPDRQHARESIERFARTNDGAQTRAELRFT